MYTGVRIGDRKTGFYTVNYTPKSGECAFGYAFRFRKRMFGAELVYRDSKDSL